MRARSLGNVVIALLASSYVFDIIATVFLIPELGGAGRVSKAPDQPDCQCGY
jgi:hypothetical protein